MASPIRHDAQGFLIGQRRLESGIGAVYLDTQEILRILRGDLSLCAGEGQSPAGAPPSGPHRRTMQPPARQAAHQGSQRQARAIDRLAQAVSRTPTVVLNQGGLRPASRAGASQPAQAQTHTLMHSAVPLPGNGGSQRQRDARGRFTGPGNEQQTRTIRTPEDAMAEARRQRDARGRFTGGGRSQTEQDNEERSFIGRLANAIGERVGEANAQVPDSLDPIVDSFNEVQQMLAPVGRVAGRLFGSREDREQRRQRRKERQQERVQQRMERHAQRQEQLQGQTNRLLRGRLGGTGGLVSGATTAILRLMLPIAAILGGALIAIAPEIGAAIAVAIGAYLAGKLVDYVSEKNDQAGNPIGEGIARVLAFFGNDEAKAAVAANQEGESSKAEDAPNVPGPLGGNGVRNQKMHPQAAQGARQYLGMAREEWTRAGFSKAAEQEMLAGQIEQESQWNPTARSHTGVRGIGQFETGTARQYGARFGTDPESVRSQFRAQAAYMRDLLKMFGGDWDKALTAYNAGQGTVQKAIKLGGANWKRFLPKSENRDYAKNVGSKSANYDFTGPQTADAPQALTGHPERATGKSSLGKMAAQLGLPSAAHPTPAAQTQSLPIVTVDQALKVIPAKPVQQAAPVMPQPMPPYKPKPMPQPPKTQREVSSNNTPQPVTVVPSSDTISQNVGDRMIAHAVTGGLGMGRWDDSLG